MRSVREHLKQRTKIEDAILINTHIARIEVQSDRLIIELSMPKAPIANENETVM